MSAEGKKSAPTTVYIIRHGDRADKAHEKFEKRKDKRDNIPLSKLGFRQAEAVGKYFANVADPKPQFILSSPYLRTLQTSLPTSKALGVSVEIENGVWEAREHRTPPDHSEKHPEIKAQLTRNHKSLYQPAVPEGPDEYAKRIPAVGKVLSKFLLEKGQHTAIFTHASVCCGMSSVLGNIPFNDIPGIGPCTISKIEADDSTPSGWRTVFSMQTSHLPDSSDDVYVPQTSKFWIQFFGQKCRNSVTEEVEKGL